MEDELATCAVLRSLLSNLTPTFKIDMTITYLRDYYFIFIRSNNRGRYQNDVENECFEKLRI